MESKYTCIVKSIILLVQLDLCYKSMCLSHEFTASDDKEEFILHSQLASENQRTDNNIPILVWWTQGLFAHVNRNSLEKIKCSLGDCFITANRKYKKDKRTAAILFYGSEIQPDDIPLPRRQWPLWALFHEESPLNNYLLCHLKFLRLFNYTATSRQESDFPVTLQYVPDNDYFTSRAPIPVALKNKFKKERGMAPVLYIQSHCAVPSDRDRYVKELMKYIPIDSYGKCLNNKDIPKDFEDPAANLYNPDFLDFIAPYKFHLAFENAILNDYMTEKLMKVLHIGSIPVYKGAPNAREWMPNNKSAIFVDDFKSPKDLAEFIKRLDEDDKEYESYLKYKTEGISNHQLKRSLERREWRVNNVDFPDKIKSYECFLCDQITKYMNLKSKNSQLPDPKIAEKSHFGCSQPYTLLIDPSDVPRKDVWHEVDWISLYWMAFDHALVVEEMIRSKEKDSTKFNKYLQKLYKKRRNK